MKRFLSLLVVAVFASSSLYAEGFFSDMLVKFFAIDVQYISEGHKAFGKKDYEESLRYYKKAISYNPKRAMAYRYAGLSYYYMGDKKNATIYLKKALMLSPKNKDIAIDLGDVFYYTSKYDNAIKYYTLASKIDENYDLGYIRSSACYLAMGDWEKTKRTSKEVIKRFPKRYEGYNNLAIALYRQKKYKEGIDVLKRYLDISTDNSEIYYLLGVCYQKLKEYDKAFEAFKKSDQLKPNDVATAEQLASLYSLRGEFEKARELYKIVIADDGRLADYLAVFEIDVVQGREFDKKLVKEFLQICKEEDSQSYLAMFDMLKDIKLSLKKSLDMDKLNKRYNVKKHLWDFTLLQKWADGIKDKNSQKRVKEAVKFFKTRFEK